ncbi:Hypothetical protein, putative [Bodo saltans]|uniref:Uncharacterized protein n=1 Tax=Bodo saltans TaxID=75058 RepID=A0A0S4IY48_BODSA|nr:Hypothetical protein, putative [Bodo saltans]|eukprot:CUG51496.1 Hypothetical protein, putative [Bodo saltans]
MFRSTLELLGRGQYKTRLKKRMVGYLPKVIPRKIKGNMVALRSEANTGAFEGYLKTEAERLDATGRKIQRPLYDPILQRFTLFKEAKIKGPFMTKSHILKKAEHPQSIK